MHLIFCEHSVVELQSKKEFSLQQIAFKNLVQRNRQAEQQANRPPPPNSIIHLPFIIVNTSKKTVIDCSISNDKYVVHVGQCFPWNNDIIDVTF